MTRTWKLGIALLWLWPAAVALRYRLLWDHLPPRLATHFNAAGVPNGWMSPQESLYFSLGLMALVLAIATAVLMFVRKPDGAAWALLGLFYVIAGVTYKIDDAVLGYNLGRPLRITGPVVVLLAAIVIMIAVSLMSRRGSTLASTTLIAEEVHSAPGFAWLFFLPLAIEAAVIAAVPSFVVRLALAASGLALLGAGAMAWSGFHYIFTSAGVEIRTLGFRLRSIPASEIQNYVPDSWGIIGGYGIRGIGSKRAYVWGNKGVLVKTSEGEVFLGHNEPQRIVRDLDSVTQGSHS